MFTYDSLLTGQQIAKEILRSICESASDGEEVKQNELADALGVSRMPVREALSLLAHDGYIIRHTNRHISLYKLTDDLLWEDIRLLAVTEAEIIINLKNRGISLDSVRNILRMNPEDITSAHIGLAELCPNPYLQKSLENMINGYFTVFCMMKQYKDNKPFLQMLENCEKGSHKDVSNLVYAYFENWFDSIMR